MSSTLGSMESLLFYEKILVDWPELFLASFWGRLLMLLKADVLVIFWEIFFSYCSPKLETKF